MLWPAVVTASTVATATVTMPTNSVAPQREYDQEATVTVPAGKPLKLRFGSTRAGRGPCFAPLEFTPEAGVHYRIEAVREADGSVCGAVLVRLK